MYVETDLGFDAETGGRRVNLSLFRVTEEEISTLNEKYTFSKMSGEVPVFKSKDQLCY